MAVNRNDFMVTMVTKVPRTCTEISGSQISNFKQAARLLKFTLTITELNQTKLVLGNVHMYPPLFSYCDTLMSKTNKVACSYAIRHTVTAYINYDNGC